MRTYTIKQLLFGLREVYIENEKKLNELKKYIQPKDDVKLGEFDIYTYVKRNNAYLELNLKAQQSMIMHLLETIQNRRIHDDRKRKIEIGSSLNGKKDYLVIPKTEIIQKIDIEQLCKEAYDILENDFTKNINTPVINNEEDKIDFEATTTGIITHTGDTGKYPSTGIIYNAKADTIMITPYYQTLFYNEAVDIFNAELPANQFSDWHNDVVDHADIDNRELIIKGLSSNTTVSQTFKVEKNDKDITLSRIKK